MILFVLNFYKLISISCEGGHNLYEPEFLMFKRGKHNKRPFLKKASVFSKNTHRLSKTFGRPALFSEFQQTKSTKHETNCRCHPGFFIFLF